MFFVQLKLGQFRRLRIRKLQVLSHIWRIPNNPKTHFLQMFGSLWSRCHCAPFIWTWWCGCVSTWKKEKPKSKQIPTKNSPFPNYTMGWENIPSYVMLCYVIPNWVGASWGFLRFETTLGQQLIEVGHSHTDAHLHRNQLDGLLRICPPWKVFIALHHLHTYIVCVCILP